MIKDYIIAFDINYMTLEEEFFISELVFQKISDDYEYTTKIRKDPKTGIITREWNFKTYTYLVHCTDYEDLIQLDELINLREYKVNRLEIEKCEIKINKLEK